MINRVEQPVISAPKQPVDDKIHIFRREGYWYIVGYAGWTVTRVAWEFVDRLNARITR